MSGATPEFDPIKYKAATREQWDAAAKGWNEWSPVLRAWLGPVTERMLDLAGVAAGSHVLDIAAGAGDQTQHAAARVGAGGRVLATDLSPGILAFAAENARQAGYGNVETAVMDGEALEVPAASFDAVICRLGLMFFPDLPTALSGMGRALKPGGRLAAIVFSAPEKNHGLAIPFAIGCKHAGVSPPGPGKPGLFKLSDPAVIEENFAAAGFRNIQIETVSLSFKLASLAEYLRFMKDSAGPLRAMIDGLDPAARDAAWGEIEAEMGQFESDGGFALPSELLLAAAAT